MTKRILTFGEALIDVYPDHRVVAGAPLHVAVHLASWGWDARLITRLGDDPDGRRVAEEIERRGVRTDYVETDPALPTGTVTIRLAAGGAQHTFTIHRPVAWDAIVGPPELPSHAAFHYGTLAARAPVSRAALLRCLAASDAPLRLFDINLRPPDLDPEFLRTGLEYATVLKMNDEELEMLGPLLDAPPDGRAFFAGRPALRWVCITRGPRGAELHHCDGERWEIAGPVVEVVDTVGAGDAFAAGLIDALADGATGGGALERASEAARGIVAVRGGLPPLSGYGSITP